MEYLRDQDIKLTLVDFEKCDADIRLHLNPCYLCRHLIFLYLLCIFNKLS